MLAYESRLVELERDRKRRTWLAALCALAVVCVLSALTLWEFKRRERHMHAKDEAVRLSGMIQKEQWDEAQKALDRVSPEMLRFSELSGVAKQVKDGVRREQRRRQDFTQRLQQVETLLDQLGSASSLESADSRLAELTKLIDETTAQLALGEQEKQRLRTLGQTADSQRKTMQDAWNQAFAEQLQQVEARLTSLEQELGATAEQLALLVPTAIVKRSRCGSVWSKPARRSRRCCSGVPRSIPIARTGREPRAASKQLSQTLEQHSVAFPSEQRITAALPDLDKFHTELSKYREQFPATLRVSQDVLAERDLWAGLGAWSDWRGVGPPRRVLSCRRRPRPLGWKTCAAWASNIRTSPNAATSNLLTPHLEAIRSRNDGEGRWLPAALKQNLETNIFFNNWTLLANTKVGSPADSAKTEKKYYLLRA